MTVYSTGAGKAVTVKFTVPPSDTEGPPRMDSRGTVCSPVDAVTASDQ